MRGAKEWGIPIVLAFLLFALATRVPIIVAIAKPEEHEVPAACFAGPEAIRGALAAAPRAVTLEGGGRLSECFTRSSESGEVQQLSTDFLQVSAELSREARARPESKAAAQLGYLIATVRRGAGTTGGIHATMRRRINQEGVGLERSRAFRRGERAGLRFG